MPVYTYRCEACREEFEIRHGMFHNQEVCILCKRKETLQKIPEFSFVKKINANQPGKIVDKHIKEMKAELKQEKERLNRETIKE